MATAEQTSRTRHDFSKIKTSISVPNLIEVQKRSYERFLQMYTAPEDREDIGLQAVFKSVFQIRDFNETSSVGFVSYNLEKPKYDVDECRQRGRRGERDHEPLEPDRGGPRHRTGRAGQTLRPHEAGCAHGSNRSGGTLRADESCLSRFSLCAGWSRSPRRALWTCWPFRCVC